jgi:hypothetical protein
VDVELFRRPKFDQEVETKGKERGFSAGGTEEGKRRLGFPGDPRRRDKERRGLTHSAWWGKGAGRGHAFCVLASRRGQLRKACSGSGKVDHREGRKNGSNS